MLNRTGEVFVWFPSDAWHGSALTPEEMDAEDDYDDDDDDDENEYITAGYSGVHSDEIPCTTWNLRQDTFKLPGLPELPSLPVCTGAEPDVKLVKIAGLENTLIGLTNHGHVLLFGLLTNESSAKSSRWTYVGDSIYLMELAQRPC